MPVPYAQRKDYIREWNARLRKERPEYRSAMKRASKLRTLYGMTPEDYDEMLAAQGGGCAVCGKARKLGERRLPVDHCHTTGRVRGILCTSCNRGIGYLADNPERVEKAAAYLRAGQGD